MPLWFWITVAAVVAALCATALVLAIASTLASRRRSERLRERFGLEYDRALAAAPSRRAGEQELLEREDRHRELDIRPLAPEARERFARRWTAVQLRFVESPAAAVWEAERLVQMVTAERGYPAGDFEQRAADLSVTYPNRVDSYRSARAIGDRAPSGEATTEELRQGLLDYRTLFEDLIRPTAGPGGATGADTDFAPNRVGQSA